MAVDPASVRPMLATTAAAPLDSAEFVYEPKYDGIRAIAIIEPGRPAAERGLRTKTPAYVGRVPRSGPAGPILLVIAGVVTNLLLAETAGFVIASTALFWLTARAFDPRHPLRDAAYAAAVSLGAYLLFARVLDLALPSGPLAGWL